jgi:hypothetical protein
MGAVTISMKKPATSPAFPFHHSIVCYLRFFLAAARSAFFLARVRAPLRAEALRWALVLRPPFLAAFRARLLAAAIVVSPR